MEIKLDIFFLTATIEREEGNIVGSGSEAGLKRLILCGYYT
jgi:hypothetical protein